MNSLKSRSVVRFQKLIQNGVRSARAKSVMSFLSKTRMGFDYDVGSVSIGEVLKVHQAWTNEDWIFEARFSKELEDLRRM